MKKWNVAAIRAAKGNEKLGCCTAYDACFARLADEAGVPVILVGDSLGMNVLGYETTIPVEMDDVLSAVRAVSRAAKNALVVGDMPFGSYQCGEDEALANAVALIKAGADAVKLEGGESVCGLIRRLVDAGIPVLAHVGMMPQSVNVYGGFKKQGKTREAAEKVFADAKAVEAAGAFAVT
ncbi:MAG: 3-methyl-2-oxobutanoate hydroxymethyltransferase, partial [Kiritimatiellae bacterium]|nr:3-methyl-2-oxobutanoate hydroxymethyltransferase [Kiritimatiellia bacterium]